MEDHSYFAFEEFFPVVLGFFPRDEFVEWSDVQDDAIVEIGYQMQVRRPTQFVLEVTKFGEEVFLPFHFLGETLGFLTRYRPLLPSGYEEFRGGWFPSESSARRNSPTP